MDEAGSAVIALVGMPGCGKSTVGRQLAKRLNWTFADADAVIEARLGTSIRSFFDANGEAAFRDIEVTVVNELTLGSRLVLATGGGAVLREANRARLHQRCRVVYLRSSPEEIHRRLRHDTSRPLLQVADPLARLREMFALRDPLYRKTAHFVVDTGRPSIGGLVNTVLMQLELAGAIEPGVSLAPVKPPPGEPAI